MRRSFRQQRWTGVLLLLVATACGGSDAPPQAAEDVFVAWKSAGLEITKLETVEQPTLGDASCRRGLVKGVEAILCSYERDATAAAAQPAGLALVGKTTGAAMARGKVLLIVADRDGADPTGKTINKMTKAFLGK